LRKDFFPLKNKWTMKPRNKVPAHLSDESKKFWSQLVDDYGISDAAGLRILRVSCEAFDRAQSARQAIDESGMLLSDKFGQAKVNPLLPVERDSRAAFLAGLKALNLDVAPDCHRIGRPPGS
jgi:P27 family predicted phage terminase small subunit